MANDQGLVVLHPPRPLDFSRQGCTHQKDALCIRGSNLILKTHHIYIYIYIYIHKGTP